MKRFRKFQAAVAAAMTVPLARLAVAAGDSGTGSMGEMTVGPGMILMFLGALVVLGLVLWLLTKFLSK